MDLARYVILQGSDLSLDSPHQKDIFLYYFKEDFGGESVI